MQRRRNDRVIDAERCTSCDICVSVCPTNVFETSSSGLPAIARQGDRQTCFTCELYCPEGRALRRRPIADRAPPPERDVRSADATDGQLPPRGRLD